MAIKNIDLLKYVEQKSPQFKSLTSKITADTFTEAGYDRMKAVDTNALTEFYGLSMRVYLQFINVAEIKDPLEIGGFGEVFDNPIGGYIQREAVTKIKPVNPAWKNLQDGKSVDPFVVRKGEVTERFWKQNFDFQTLLTIPDDFVMKQMFINEYGISTFVEGQIQQLKNSYAVQKYLAKKEAIDAFLTGNIDRLQDSQQIDVEYSNTPTDAQLVNFILAVKNVVSTMGAVPSTSAFNALKFDSSQDIKRLKLLVRVGFKNEVALKVLRNSFHAETLNLPVDVIEVDNFGGLIPYDDENYSNRVYPVYDTLGTMIGFSRTENQIGKEHVDFHDDDVFWKDPHEDVLAILADKGLIFTSVQNGVQMNTIYNPRGLYTNYFLSMPNATVAIDNIYNAVVFKKVAPTTSGSDSGSGGSSLPPGYVP